MANFRKCSCGLNSSIPVRLLLETIELANTFRSMIMPYVTSFFASLQTVWVSIFLYIGILCLDCLLASLHPNILLILRTCFPGDPGVPGMSGRPGIVNS